MNTEQTWWVYEDDATNYARIHLGDCSFCNNGIGVRESRLPNNRWHGSFNNLEEAIQKAMNTDANNIAGCGVCQPAVGALR